MWQDFSVEEILERLKTNNQYGLREKEVIFREEQYGKNELKDKKKESIFTKFLKQFNDYMIIILIIASIISAVISFVQGENDYIDSIIIIGIVIFNAILGVIQEAKAEKAIEALKEMIAPKAKVLRDGKVIEVDAKGIVVGDIIILEAGNFVPADARLIETYNLKVEEASLTRRN